MTNSTSLFGKLQNHTLIFILSIVVSVYWIGSRIIDVYHYAVVGVLAELFWLPMLVLLLCLPVVCMIFLIKNKFNIRSLNLYSFVIILVTFLIVFFY